MGIERLLDWNNAFDERPAIMVFDNFNCDGSSESMGICMKDREHQILKNLIRLKLDYF